MAWDQLLVQFLQICCRNPISGYYPFLLIWPFHKPLQSLNKQLPLVKLALSVASCCGVTGTCQFPAHCLCCFLNFICSHCVCLRSAAQIRAGPPRISVFSAPSGTILAAWTHSNGSAHGPAPFSLPPRAQVKEPKESNAVPLFSWRVLGRFLFSATPSLSLCGGWPAADTGGRGRRTGSSRRRLQRAQQAAMTSSGPRLGVLLLVAVLLQTVAVTITVLHFTTALNAVRNNPCTDFTCASSSRSLALELNFDFWTRCIYSSEGLSTFLCTFNTQPDEMTAHCNLITLQ